MDKGTIALTLGWAFVLACLAWGWFNPSLNAEKRRESGQAFLTFSGLLAMATVLMLVVLPLIS